MSDRLLTLAATQWEVVSTADATRLDVDPNALAELVRAGTLVRVRRGAYVVGEQWAAAPERRLDLRTRAVLHPRAHPGEAATHRAPSPSTVSHFTASPRMSSTSSAR